MLHQCTVVLLIKTAFFADKSLKLLSPWRIILGMLCFIMQEHFTQQTAALLGKIPSPGEALPQLRKNPRFYLPSDSAVGGRSIHGGITGVCEKDKTYKFTTQDELKAYRAELECIYARGVAPNRPPLGLWYGQIVEIGNTGMFISAVNNDQEPRRFKICTFPGGVSVQKSHFIQLVCRRSPERMCQCVRSALDVPLRLSAKSDCTILKCYLFVVFV
eukprot:GHVT01066644.1.p1 GENE.GHVT01066644.1~~GHVT01066644.1.p1  ORF type:complete len:216 (+),score=4.57 GHVT01066644.1:886-1533(+)